MADLPARSNGLRKVKVAKHPRLLMTQRYWLAPSTAGSQCAAELCLAVLQVTLLANIVSATMMVQVACCRMNYTMACTSAERYFCRQPDMS